ncbi:MAG: biotin--[acetyl-CoA-carboxylase] ligase [Planctomycetales bacterium]|nr:biotin--[acetyl-CoA-carboxylase] ligase [Planctomycetales bacterium]
MFDLIRIREESFVAGISHFDEIDSTNSCLLKQLEESSADGPLLVLAERQTAGRGRGSNQWWAANGALTFSLAVEANDLRPDQICKASLSTGLAVCQALERFVPAGDLALKWPNDVYLEGKKIAGILIERPASRSDFIVIGIGININNSMNDAPEDISSKAISLIDCIEIETDLTTVLIESLQQIESRLRSIRLGDSMLLDQWRAYCMLTGRSVTIDVYDKEISGVCTGIDGEGALLVKARDQVHRCIGGVVKSFQ